MRIIAALLLVVVTAGSCRQQRPEFKTYEGFALGTTYAVTVKGTPEQHEKVQGLMDAVFAKADDIYSIYNENSLLSRLNSGEATELNPDIAYLLEVAGVAHRLSGGKYDVTILPLKEAYGFQQGIAAQREPDVDSLLQYVGFGKLSAVDGHLRKENSGVRVDLNSVAKGYTVDLVAHALGEAGFGDYLVDIGGETFCRGLNAKGEQWKIGVERPEEGNYVKGSSIHTVISLTDKGMATSGNYRNFRVNDRGRKYTHIIDPLTGENTESNLLSATVVAESCAVADALATMFISLGLEGSLKVIEDNPDMAVLLIYSDEAGEMRIFVSEEMQNIVYSAN